MKVTKAVIPAAGFGTRFLPATKAVPKEMLPIVDKPTIQYIVEEAIASGIEDLLIITSRGKDALVNHFDKAYELETILERDGKQEMLNAVRECRINKTFSLYVKRNRKVLDTLYFARKALSETSLLR